MFWRNFIDPYAHEWQNGNSRWDLLDVARYTYALRPEGIEWPRREDGAPSFKLEHLTLANDLPHIDAHDALSDVRATIALARLIRARQPRLFDYAYALRGKNAVRDLLGREQGKPLLHTSGMFPAIHGHTTAIAVLGAHPRIQNRLIVADLRQDPERLLETSPEQLLELLFTRGEDLPDGVERPAIKELHLNRAPLLAPFRVLDEAGAERLGLDLSACQRHFDFIQTHREAFEALARGLYAAEPPARAVDAEAALYQGFMPDGDRQRLAQVRTLAPERLAELQQALQDARLRELMFRYRARHFPATLAAEERERWHDLRASRLLHEEGGAGMWAEKFFTSIEALRLDPASTGREWLILDQVEAWGRGLLNEAGLPGR
ncbi:MAG: exodeoxyribonuclease I [Halothiobacillaceae bacterium]